MTFLFPVLQNVFHASSLSSCQNKEQQELYTFMNQHLHRQARFIYHHCVAHYAISRASSYSCLQLLIVRLNEVFVEWEKIILSTLQDSGKYRIVQNISSVKYLFTEKVRGIKTKTDYQYLFILKYAHQKLEKKLNWRTVCPICYLAGRG